MKFGLNVVPVYPTQLGEVAVLAEALGYESLWVGEHVAVPFESRGGYPGGRPPFKPDSHFVEPFTALAYLGGITSRVRLGTGVAIVPIRSPIHLARQLATADVLSGGRISLGIGIGWLQDEFEIAYAPWDNRGKRLDECLAYLDAVFNAERPEYHGEFYELPPIGFEPKPIQRPHPPFLIGGSGEAALRRAAASGDGWYGGSGSPEDAAATILLLQRMRSELGRSGPFEVTMLLGWGEGFDSGRVGAYEAAGVDRLVATPWTRSSHARDGIVAFAEAAGLSRSPSTES
jgi:probable F420-dependent oxidoreductase